MKLRHFPLTLVILGALIVAPSTFAHDSPIDHIDRVVQIYIDAGRLHLVYRIRCEERQAMLQLYRMDTNRDGKISDDERDAYFKTESAGLRKQLHVEVDGQSLALTGEGGVQLAPDLSQTYHFSAPLAELTPGKHPAKFTDDFSRTHPGPYRWSPRQINPNGIAVDADQAPTIQQAADHSAMIVIKLTIEVGAIRSTAPTPQR